MNSMFGRTAYIDINLEWYNIFPSYFFLFLLLQRNFFQSGYVIKPLQPSSTMYGAPPFTGNQR